MRPQFEAAGRCLTSAERIRRWIRTHLVGEAAGSGEAEPPGGSGL
ncbi:MAG: hypothetical protein OXG81_11140 [Acidobacteria bacterium]|nr:hypothetical protein [Acidobacteriota bacterium]